MSKNLKITVLTPEFYSYGALLIAGILQEQGYPVKLQKGFGEVIDADIVFISLQSTIHLLKYQKEISSMDTFKIVGGPVTLSPQLILDCLAVDLVVVGEGENTLYNILKVFENNPIPNVSDFKDVSGVAFKKDEQTIITGKGTAHSLERPLPLVPSDISSENIRGANVYLETHRGCPGNCGFCGVPCLFGREVRSRSLEDILNEVKYLLSKGVRKIAISGGTGSLYGSNKFKNVDEEAFIELLREISNLTGPKNLTIPDIRVDLISDQILEAIHQYSNGWVFFGIESGSDRVLRHMKKGVTVDQVREAVAMAREHGVKTAGSFIVAYPGEEEEEFQDTMDLADELMLDDYFVSIAEPIPGTDLGDEVSQLSLEDNILFQDSLKYKRHGLSIAEERALDLMVESYIFRSFPVPMSQNLLKNLLDEVKSQGDHIKSVTHLIKKYPTS
ncbi:MAG: TIGR04014 family B12-binding domain/radical SAM domain-containing protein [Methanobacterium sp.]|jgi:B12-binding domain/radical SAM domain protein|uniref:methyl-coenzyme M reductase glutamine C-methyltransferase n=1 Tax=Methanobacterium sp. TaxID=2164 RepID=UPI002583011D|nr:methyl-coenzyme M reductase glutamine C-methyltransferase [Methanobacterium sp.]MCC7559140.1 TIGR04014 family B12-binding domain/radical SAM domain-containing protein [Methanobacterium sp.]